MSELRPGQGEAPAHADKHQARDRRLRLLAALIGVALAVIGLRFLWSPTRAAGFFGLGGTSGEAAGLHHVVGLRDLWLGLLALAFAGLGEWRALAVWLALGALVCFGDAVIVIMAGGPGLARAFHLGSGVICAALALAIWRRSRLPC